MLLGDRLCGSEHRLGQAGCEQEERVTEEDEPTDEGGDGGGVGVGEDKGLISNLSDTQLCPVSLEL